MMLKMHVELRPAADSDLPFVERTYFATQRWLIEQLFGWRGDAFERGKFTEFYRQDETSIIVAGGQEAGWIAVVRSPDGIGVDGIYVLPEYQRRGIGTALLRGLMLQAAAERKPLRLSTAKINPARALYVRLGFREIEEDRYKVYMEYCA